MMPNDQVRRTLELTNRYYAPAVEAANRGRSVYRSIEPQLNRLSRQLREIEDFSRYLLLKTFTLARGGWHDAPMMEASAHSVKELVAELVNEPDEEIKRRLDIEVPGYFRGNECRALWDMFDRWDLFPGWRRSVFEDAFDAHKNGKYTLSVPALAPQIEGMLREVPNEYGEDVSYIQKVNEALGFSYARRHPPSPPTREELEGALDALSGQPIWDRHDTAERISLQHALFRVNELYNRVEFSNLGAGDSGNRHAVLHGVATDYGELDSLKLFCAVQLVHEIVDGYKAAIDAESTAST